MGFIAESSKSIFKISSTFIPLNTTQKIAPISVITQNELMLLFNILNFGNNNTLTIIRAQVIKKIIVETIIFILIFKPFKDQF